MAAAQGSPVVPLLLLLVGLAGTAFAQTDTVCAANNSKIHENSPIGSEVTTIRLDPGVTVILDTTENSQLFGINGSEVILEAPLDYEKVGPTIVLMLTCQQGGSNVQNLVIIVEVLDVNDNIPVFQETSVSWSIPEDVAVGSSIGTLSAKDADEIDTIYYDLQVDIPKGDSHFKLAGRNSPVIQVIRALDYDNFTFAHLILYARDTEVLNASSHTATATINITIMDVDNKNPWFIPCKFVDPNEKICLSDGYRVNVTRATNMTDALVLTPGPLYAIDGDKGINEAIKYELLPGNVGDIFGINNNTGNITVKKPPDVLGTTILNVMASQVNNYFRYATTIVIINVVEKNNHPPTFPRTDYNGTIPAYSEQGSFIMEYNSPSRPLKIFAEDDDFPDKKNPSITYSIVNSSEFIISQDGFIQSNAQLNSSGTIGVEVVALDRTSGEKATTPVFVAITPIIGAETTTIAPTTFTMTATTPVLRSSVQPPEMASGTTIMPSQATSSHSFTGSKATGITNKPTSPSAQSAVTTKTTSATGSETTTVAPTIFTTTATTPVLRSSVQPPEMASGTTKMPPQTTSSPSFTGSKATGITNKPTSPSAQTAVTTKTMSATGNPTTTTLSVASVPSLNVSSPTTPLALGSTSTKKPFTGTMIASSRTTKITAGPPDSNTTNGPQTGMGTTISSTIRVTTAVTVRPTVSRTTVPPQTGTGTTKSRTTRVTPPGSAAPPVPGTTLSPQIGTGSTTSRTTAVTTPVFVTPPGSVTTKPSTPRSGPTTSRITTTTTTPQVGGSPGHGSTIPPKPGTSPSGGTILLPQWKYSAEDMAAVGASLGAILLLCIGLLGFLIHKHYGCKFKKLSELDIQSGSGDSLEGNKTLIDNDYLYSSTVDPPEAGDDGATVNLTYNAAETTTEESSISGSMAKRAIEETQTMATIPAASLAIDRLDGDVDGDKEVKSILTKERRVNDESYKAVWFKGDIEPDEVVMINEHEPSGEGQGDDDDDDDGDEQDDEDNNDEDEDDDDPDYKGRSDNQSPKVVFSTNNVPADSDQPAYTML